MERNQAKSLNVAAAGVLQAVAVAGPMGAPGGHLYAGLMGSGYSFVEYESIMGALAANGFVSRRGQCYTLTDKGAVINARITAAIEQHQRKAA